MENEFGKGERLGPAHLIAEDGSLPPLRMSSLLIFLSLQGRSPRCPHCDWEGGWELALHDMDADDEDEQGFVDPKLEILVHANMRGTTRTTVGMTCPNCGHFAEVSTYKIRQVLDQAQGKDE